MENSILEVQFSLKCPLAFVSMTPTRFAPTIVGGFIIILEVTRRYWVSSPLLFAYTWLKHVTGSMGSPPPHWRYRWRLNSVLQSFLRVTMCGSGAPPTLHSRPARHGPLLIRQLSISPFWCSAECEMLHCTGRRFGRSGLLFLASWWWISSRGRRNCANPWQQIKAVTPPPPPPLWRWFKIFDKIRNNTSTPAHFSCPP